MNKMIKTVSAAALIASVAGASFAGTLAQPTGESQPQQDDDVFAAAPSSGISAPVIVGALVAAAVIAGIAGNDSDSDTQTAGDSD